MEGGEIVLKSTGFQGAATGEITRIEIEHQPAAAEISQPQMRGHGLHGGLISLNGRG
jgi:hypothetical protein